MNKYHIPSIIFLSTTISSTRTYTYYKILEITSTTIGELSLMCHILYSKYKGKKTKQPCSFPALSKPLYNHRM